MIEMEEIEEITEDYEIELEDTEERMIEND
jgi:hypothetical protein